MKFRHKQRGMTLIMLVFIVGLAAMAYLMYALNPTTVKIERDKKTTAALAMAKSALLAYASSVNVSLPCFTNFCPRPGDLPCPDTDNNGTAETSCGDAAGATGQTNRLGRLPWKTLGLDDLRDGHGERLWYAVSSRYKNNTRYRPLNSDTLGTVTVRDSAGTIINNGASSSGVVATVLSPGSVIVRQDGVSQTRATSQENNPNNYLDVALGEDNADFSDSNTNGFIMGPINGLNGNEILNDRILVITRHDMAKAMESRVLAESRNAMLDYYCGGNADHAGKSCGAASATGAANATGAAAGNSAFSAFFPSPALFSDATCLGNGSLTGSSCSSNTTSSVHGRIPANPNTAWSATSIFRGASTGNWFQLNAWRELVHYAVAPACANGTSNCSSTGLLILNNAVVLPTNTKQVVLISAGTALTSQSRATNAAKALEANYLEGENLIPLDNTYVRTVPLSSSINDRAMSLP